MYTYIDRSISISHCYQGVGAVSGLLGDPGVMMFIVLTFSWLLSMPFWCLYIQYVHIYIYIYILTIYYVLYLSLWVLYLCSALQSYI